MPRRPDGAEPGHRRLFFVLRTCSLVLGVALTAVGAWLVVTSTTQKHIELGVIAGLWGLLLGGAALFGGRHALSAPAAAPPDYAGQQLEVRSSAAVERSEDAQARRDYEQRLEQMLRREIQASLARELDALRSEITSLRSEIVEKVGGQLRLERIETTRVIGSGIEALQDEVGRLKFGRRTDDFADYRMAPVSFAKTEPAAAVAPTRAAAEPVAAEPIAAEPIAAEPIAAEPARPPSPPAAAARPPAAEPPRSTTPPATVPVSPPAAEGTAGSAASASIASPPAAPPVAVQPVAPSVAAEPVAPVAAAQPVPPLPSVPPVPSAPPIPSGPEGEFRAHGPAIAIPAATVPIAGSDPGPSTDPFASMPRIRPFTDFDLDPVSPPPAAPSVPSAPSGTDEPGTGRHSSGETEPSSGGRRRRAEEDGHDMLARILQREGAR